LLIAQCYGAGIGVILTDGYKADVNVAHSPSRLVLCRIVEAHCGGLGFLRNTKGM